MFAFYRILGQHYFFCSSRFITVNALPFIPDAVFNDVQDRQHSITLHRIFRLFFLQVLFLAVNIDLKLISYPASREVEAAKTSLFFLSLFQTHICIRAAFLSACVSLCCSKFHLLNRCFQTVLSRNKKSRQ